MAVWPFAARSTFPGEAPSGGDGGDGGSVYLRSTSQLNTLLPFSYRKHLRAERGGPRKRCETPWKKW